MNKRMLIDTTHAEETRVVVLDGNRLEDYDVETSAKKQLKGNIYLAKVIRVEPSLQAAFVEYGGNRHGFLAFSEIHPDYYQIPVADRERLIALQEEEARAEEAREDAAEEAKEAAREAAGESDGDDFGARDGGENGATSTEEPDSESGSAGDHPDHRHAALSDGDDTRYGDDNHANHESRDTADESGDESGSREDVGSGEAPEAGLDPSGDQSHDDPSLAPGPENFGGESDGGEDRRPSPQSARFLRQYKIQEVIRRRQILLIQVVKEERGNKGAALTTYISLAGRFCVLMPNSLRGGGVSRKITSAADRRRLKEITTELDIPRGMAMIIRTAGAQRPRPEIRRDCEYLLRLWDDIRDQTLRAMAPALIYEEANLIKRAIRDVYTRDIEEIVVDGETGWKAAREFMRNLMPANAQKVQLWRDHAQPLFSYFQVEHHLDSMLQPVVQLRSGGYLVINQTEALVAIDVNSGRSTRERGIEETALRTNLEAADEVARQLRLRDLAGLIVIDFIDMEARRHNAMVERRLKDALRNDRARIQLGSISHFGLMEMSRQRLRPSIAESSFVTCPHCAGSGFVRGTDSAALHVLRAIEEEGARQRAAEILVHVANSVALYIFNNKRVWLAEIEQRHRMVVNFAADDSLIPPAMRIDKVRSQVPLSAPIQAQITVPQNLAPEIQVPASEPHDTTRGQLVPANAAADAGFERGGSDPFENDEDDEADEELGVQDAEPASAGAAGIDGSTAESGEEERKRKRRRRRRRGGRREDANGASPQPVMSPDAEQPDIEGDVAFPGAEIVAFPTGQNEAEDHVFAPDDGDGDGEIGVRAKGEIPLSEEQGTGARKRGRRGGARGRKPQREQDGSQDGGRPAAYSGPTPADPFGTSYDIFDIIEQDVEAAPPRTIAPHAEIVPEPEAEPISAMPEPTAEPELLDLLPEPEAAAEPEIAAKPKRKRAPARSKIAAASDDAEAKPKAVPARKPRARKVVRNDAQVDLPEAPLAAASEAPAAETREADEAADRGKTATVQPILIDTLEAPAARRTGWWKR